MMSKRMMRCLSALCWLVGVSASWAQGLPAYAGKFALEEQQKIWRFFADGSSSEEDRSVLRALSAEGAQEITSIPMSYQEGWETLELMEAYTLKSDGRRVELPRDTIQKQTGMMGGSTGLTWPEYRGWQLKYPDVQVGDRVVFHYKHTQTKPYLPGWATYRWLANHNWNTEKISIEVQAPKDMPLALEVQGLEASRADTDSLQIHRFTGHVEAKSYDVSAQNMSTTVARVLVSTLASTDAWANAFGKGMADKAVLTPTLTQIAERETKGLVDPTAKAKALYDWVRKNIRYNAVFIGAGGWVPNGLNAILDKRYGDCKDHALLLVSLLKAVGIDAVPALINVGSDYVLPAVPVGFNHVIVHIPSLGIYLDPTATQVPYGELPLGDRGKPVALARATGSNLAQTPAILAERNVLETSGDFTIAPSGALHGTVKVAAQGNAAMVMQQALAQVPPLMAGEAVRRVLEKAHLNGSGFLRYPALNRDVAVQTAEVDVDISNYLSSPEAGSFSISPRMPDLPLNIASNYSNFSAEQRRFAIPCVPVTVREAFTFRFDPQFKVDRVPKNIAVNADGISFKAEYSFENNVLQTTREYVDTNPAMFCDVALYDQRKAMMRSITKHLRQQLLYQQ